MNKHLPVLCAAFIKRYKFRLAGFALGWIAGWWGALTGFLIGFFVEVIFLRTAEEVSLASYFANPAGKKIAEPFPGAALLSALAVASCRDARFAEEQLKAAFPAEKPELWHTFCIAAQRAGVERDLLAECLASRLLRVKNPLLVESVFTVLQAAEFGWTEALGERPTQYLSRLLNYSFYADDYAAACAVLGVGTDATLDQIKIGHRRLAAVYHPDTLSALSDEQQKIAADAFLRVQKAYETILERF